MRDNSCEMCKGTTKNIFNEACIYCNGTGEWNQAAAAYLKNHICQCINWNRSFCPICKKRCHHDSALSPKQKIDPRYGSMTNDSSTDIIPEEEMLPA